VGQTYNSSLTAQYINRYNNMLAAAGGVDLILNVADLAVRSKQRRAFEST